MSYEVDTGFISVSADTRSPGARADIFFTAYSRNLPASHQPRPLVFAYNGGPGGSSAGVHFGAFGPRVISPVEPGREMSVSPELVDNPATLLDAADLVFIDPPGTGFSRLCPQTKPSYFYGVQQDAFATARFVERYFKQTGRSESPFYLLGESYGTLRSVLVARQLQQRGFFPRGLILMSLILDNNTLFPQAGNDEPYWMFLPTEAAVNRFYAAPSHPARELLPEDSGFAEDSYAHALRKGDTLSETERMNIASQLSQRIGIGKETIIRQDLRITPDAFSRERLRDQGLMISKADGRFVGQPTSSTGPYADPLYAKILPAYAAVASAYYREELRIGLTGVYKVLDTSVADQWRWDPTTFGSPTALVVNSELHDALVTDPKLQVFSANGTYDLTSPVLAAEYTLSHLGLAHAAGTRILFHQYESGHMIYVSLEARTLLHADIAAFIENTR